MQIKEVAAAPAGYKSISESIQKSNEELAEIEAKLNQERAALEDLKTQRKKEADAIDAANKVQASLQEVSSTFEVFAGKLTAAQLAVQASDTPAQHSTLWKRSQRCYAKPYPSWTLHSASNARKQR